MNFPAAALAGGLATLLAGVMLKKKKGATTPDGAGTVPSEVSTGAIPDVLREKIARALITQNPETIEQVATECAKAGFTDEARRLRAVAAELRARQRGEPIPDVTIPGGESPEAPDNALAFKVRQAQALHDHLQGSSRYKEDRAKVKAFQAMCDLKQDGLYGWKTALCSAAVGVIPVKPFYWSKTTSRADKNQYRKQMTRYAAADPKRADAWQEAAAV